MNGLDEFRTTIDIFNMCWNSIRIQSVCIFAHEKWLSLGTRITLSEGASQEGCEKQGIQLNELQVFEKCFDINKLDEILSGLETGKLKICGEVIYFDKADNVKQTTTNLHFNFCMSGEKRLPDWVQHDIEYPYIAIYNSGDTINSYINSSKYHDVESINARLRSLEIPYKDIIDLITSTLSISSDSLSVSHSTPLVIVAPIHLKFNSKSKLSQGKLEIFAEYAEHYNVDQISLGIIGYSQNKPIYRQSHCLQDRKSTRLNSSHTDISRMPSSA